MYHAIKYTRKDHGAEDYEYRDEVVFVETEADVPGYLGQVARFLSEKRAHSEFYTGAPELLASFEGQPVFRSGNLGVLTLTDFAQWVLRNCDTGRSLPPPVGFPFPPGVS